MKQEFAFNRKAIANFLVRTLGISEEDGSVIAAAVDMAVFKVVAETSKEKHVFDVKAACAVLSDVLRDCMDGMFR